MAGLEISVKHNIKEVQKTLHNFEKKALKRAAVRALNKTGTTINKEAVKRIKQRTSLTAKRVRAKMKIRKAGRNRYVWSVTGLRAATNIIEWVASSRQVPGAFRKQKGVRSRAWGKSKVYPGTFIGRGKNSGKALVFKRDPSKPSGVAGVQGPSIRSAFFQELKALEPVALNRFRVVLEQEINFEIHKMLSK